MVVPAGMDSHSFEPTPADMITIQNADLLVCNGGTMEQWLSQVLDSFGEGTGPKRVVTMMDCVDVVQEEICLLYTSVGVIKVKTEVLRMLKETDDRCV